MARDQIWRVRATSPAGGSGQLVELEDVDDPRYQLTIGVPPDNVEVLPSEDPELARDAMESLAVWNAWHGVLAATSIGSIGTSSALMRGRIAPETYQLAPTLRLLRKPRPSLLVADDVGLGKTIEAGLVIVEFLARRRAHRILIVAPPGLLTQWRSELHQKFGLQFGLIENAAGLAREQTALPAGAHPWDCLPLVLTSVDYLKKETVRKRALRKRWDLIIVDEAHALAEAGTASHPYRTQRTRLGHALRDASRGLVLLTATPHNGHSHSFRSLIELVEPTAATFRGNTTENVRRVELARIRRLKAQITRRGADGREHGVFPVREVKGLPVTVDAAWKAVLDKVSSYCSKTARAAQGTEDDDLVSFAMQIVKKRALSSRVALESTIGNRLDALRDREPSEPRPTRAEVRELQSDLPLTESAAERTSVRIVRAAVSREEKVRKAEITALNAIKKLIKALPPADPKIDALLRELRSVMDSDTSAKVIVFTEYLDTLGALQKAFEGTPELRGRWVELRGGMSSRQRTRAQERFESPEVNVLLATDAASEGLNLQRCCHRIIHFELPWNPNRLEQRNGRVDRYGQEHAPRIRYLFYPQSPEEDVLHRLVERIETMQKDRISTPDILGVLSGLGILDNRLVTLDAESTDTERQKNSLVKIFEDQTAAFVRDLQPLVAAHAGTPEELDGIAEDPDGARTLVPDDESLERCVKHLLGADAFRPIDGSPGIHEIRVPHCFQGSRVAESYSQATFLRSIAVRHRPEDVEFLAPGHPLVTALGQEARRRFLDVHASGRAVTPRRFAARRVPASERASAVFTSLVTIDGDDGCLEESILAVRVNTDGAEIGSPRDARTWIDDGNATGEVPFAALEQTFMPSFTAMSASAKTVITRHAHARANALRASRGPEATRLRADLERDLADRLAEIDDEERRASGLIAEEGQGLLFTSPETKGVSLESRRAAAHAYAKDRESELARYENVHDPASPRLLGVLFLVPEGAR